MTTDPSGMAGRPLRPDDHDAGQAACTATRARPRCNLTRPVIMLRPKQMSRLGPVDVKRGLFVHTTPRRRIVEHLTKTIGSLAPRLFAQSAHRAPFTIISWS